MIELSDAREGDKHPSTDDNELKTGKAEGFFRIYSVLSSKPKQFIIALIWTVLTALFCVWLVSFSYAVFISESPVPRLYDYSPRVTIAVVNVASHVAALLTGWMISAVLDVLSWTVISSGRGATLRTFLAANQVTSLWTVFTYLFTLGVHQLWCLLRYVDAKVYGRCARP